MQKSPQTQNKLGAMPIPRLVASVSIPLMVSMLVQSLYNIVDGIFVSRISEDALTATSLAYPAQMLMLAVSVGTGVGVNSILSRRLGQKDQAAANEIATTGLVLAALCSLVFMLLGAVASRPFIARFTQDTAVLELGCQYLRICLIGCMGIFFGTTGERLLQATGNTFLSMVAQTFGAVINIVLDPILIFGYFGLPAMGIRGAALATVIGQFGAGILSLWLNRVKNKDIHFQFRHFRLAKDNVLEIYRVGVPTMLMQTMGSLMMIGMNTILTGYESAVAAFGVYYKLYTFLYMPVSGLSQGLIPIMGFNFGAKAGRRMRDAFRLTLGIAVALMTAGAVVFVLAPGALLGLYDASDALVRIGTPLLRTMALTFPFAAVTITIGFASSGLGNGMVSMLATCMRQLVLLVPFAGLFSRLWGLDCAWYAAWVSEGCAVLFAVLAFRREYNKKIKPYL